MIAEGRTVTARQWTVLALVLAVLLVDGVDTQLLALVAPLIMQQWGVDKASFGPAMSAALFGMTLGAGIGGWLGDRLGRKTVVVGSTILFGICTVAVAFAQSLPVLVALRFVSGLGFGALAPVGAALASEWLPRRLRPRVMAVLSITIPAGGLIGGGAVLALLPRLGWTGCFILCGVATLAMAAATLALLPESPGYLAAKGQPEAAGALVRRVTGAAPEAAEEDAVARASVFTRANLRFNTGAWLAFFCLQLIAYGFLSWTPVLLTMTGWPLTRAIQAVLVFNLSAVTASLVAAAFLLDRVRFRTVALTGSIGAIVSVTALYLLVSGAPIPPAPGREAAIYAAVAAASVFVGWGIASIYALYPFGYPAGCRASGIGIGLMTGRAGGIVIALSGGALLQYGGVPPFFAVLLAAGIAAVACVLILGMRYAVRLRDLGPPAP